MRRLGLQATFLTTILVTMHTAQSQSQTSSLSLSEK